MFRKLVLFLLGLAGLAFIGELIRARKNKVTVGAQIKKDYGTVKTKVSVATGKFLEKVDAGAKALNETIKEARASAGKVEKEETAFCLNCHNVLRGPIPEGSVECKCGAPVEEVK